MCLNAGTTFAAVGDADAASGGSEVGEGDAAAASEAVEDGAADAVAGGATTAVPEAPATGLVGVEPEHAPATSAIARTAAGHLPLRTWIKCQPPPNRAGSSPATPASGAAP